MRKKRSTSLSKKIILFLISMIFIFIVYLVVFNSIPINVESPSILIKLVRFATAVKTNIMDNSVFYGFLVIVSVSLLIPAYLKFKK